jgi:hypothetical protein
VSVVGCKNCFRCATKADGKTVVRIHQADGHGQVGQFLLVKDLTDRFELDIRNAGIRYPGNRFRPGKSSLFPIAELFAGLLLWLPKGTRDGIIAREASAFGLAPSPLSAWFSSAGEPHPGLLLGVATTTEERLTTACDRLDQLIRPFS